MDKRRNIWLIVVFAIVFSLLSVVYRSAAAEALSANADIIKKLDEISSGQQKILEEIAAMKEELNIIKIRVTQIQ
jgi:hypothetical protein